MKNLVSITLICVVSLFMTAGEAMAYQEPNYEVVSRDNDIEIRLYEETVVAEVTEDRSSGSAFMILFRYIGGMNRSKRSIPMTVPVTRRPEQESTKIPMTVPVTRELGDDYRTRMAFYMPSDMPFEAVPEPLDKRVRIRKVPAQKVAVIRFSGWTNAKNIKQHRLVLERYLHDKGIDFETPHKVATYNHPMTPGFMRRNEVIYVIANNQPNDR